MFDVALKHRDTKALNRKAVVLVKYGNGYFTFGDDALNAARICELNADRVTVINKQPTYMMVIAESNLIAFINRAAADHEILIVAAP